MALAHHSNVTLVPFSLCPSFLSSPLFPVLSQRQQLLEALPLHFPPSLPPSLFLNPALFPAPLLCSLSSLPGIPAKHFLLSISLTSWKKPRRQRLLLLYFARKFHFPSHMCCRGELRTRGEYPGAADRTVSAPVPFLLAIMPSPALVSPHAA